LVVSGNEILTGCVGQHGSPAKPRAKAVKEGFFMHSHEWHSAYHSVIVIKGYVNSTGPTDPRPLQFDPSHGDYRIWLPPQDVFDLCC
jgi:hypothetical protein